MKKIYRSEDNKIIFGTIGGLGEYYDVDPALLRFAYIILMLATGLLPLVIAYLFSYFVIPKKNGK